MATPPSFAPLAARLAAHAAALRPVEGARDDWAKVVALVWCLVLEMLISLCEALDARAAAEAALAPASRGVKAGIVPALRAARQPLLGETRARRSTLALEIQATTPSRADAPSGTTERPAAAGPRLVWSRNPGPIRAVLAPPWRPYRETRPFHQRPCTSFLLRYRN